MQCVSIAGLWCIPASIPPVSFMFWRRVSSIALTNSGRVAVSGGSPFSLLAFPVCKFAGLAGAACAVQTLKRYKEITFKNLSFHDFFGRMDFPEGQIPVEFRNWGVVWFRKSAKRATRYPQTKIKAPKAKFFHKSGGCFFHLSY